MIPGQSVGNTAKTTSYKVVLPFYIYAAISFLVSAVLLLLSSEAFLGHYFQPKILAITHMMALGWGTMIILGASHQLVPVIIEQKLHSNILAYCSFVFAAIGIPLLVYGFYVFDMGHPAKWGGRFILLAIITYLINLGISISKSKTENIHAIFVFTSVVWLLITASLGLVLVYNFSPGLHLLPHDSLHYLPLHVHAGIIGWFLLLTIGVGSRLIPMFLISKYTNKKLLNWIFILINLSLLSYILLFYVANIPQLIYLSWCMLLAGIILFVYYCRSAYIQRIRRQVDDQMKISLLSVFMMLVPIILLFLVILILSLFSKESVSLSMSYGFLILFGWITAIILGMTFKTLPFIIWNKVYHRRSGMGKTPNPKDLFNDKVFKVMGLAYLPALIIFVAGILTKILLLLQLGASLMLIAAVLYVFNVFKVVTHQAIKQ
ncbi:MAG: cytochrome C oxidase subunit I [Bacteroidia bacterium]|jgi:hypothetical protein|nr:cytochrome C oxidase subunit I [Bacteroidia bacterium]